ncbi:MAG TPA: hypothetical protein VGP16_11815 [Asanoa sp.]|nr:hypothetical protein [Asanoa sp.]
MTYPCPSCKAPASLETGCPGCGRAPDPDADEVVRLNAEIAELTISVEQARQVYAESTAQLAAAHRRREDVAARVRATTFLGFGPAPSPTPVPPAPAPAAFAAAPAGETTPRTAQNVLFVLGGLLVGAAAIVFTGVAWATYGVEGRAVILAVVTALVLAVPPVTARRGLRSTAETFAAIGMLLVVLDGYAAWYANLFGIGAVDGAGYAALVCAVTAAVGAGYGRLTGLGAPRLAALVAVQPVLPLVADWLDATAFGWSLAFAGTAALDLAVVRVVGGPARVVGWIGFGCAQVAAGVCALAVLVFDMGVPVLLTGVPVLLVAVLLAAAGPVGRVSWLTAVGAATVPPALALVVLRPVAQSHGSVLPIVAAATVLVIALAATRLPVARPGALLTAGVFLLISGSAALTVAVFTMADSTPVFTAVGANAADLPQDWQLPAALVLGAAALALLVPRGTWRTATLTGGAALVVLALPTWLPLPWWALSMMDLVLAAILLLALRPALALTIAAATLTVHGVVVGLARPWSTAAVFGAVSLLGLAAAARSRRGAAQWCAVGLAAFPAAVAATVYAAGAGGAWPARAGLAAILVPLGATFVFGRLPRFAGYASAAAVALAASAVVVGVWPALSDLDEPAGVYPSAALLVVALAALGARGLARLATWVAAVPLTFLAVIAAVPTLGALLFGPYGWWEHAWSGGPSGVGLTPSGHVEFTAGPAATLLILAAVSATLILRTPTPARAATSLGGPTVRDPGAGPVVEPASDNGPASVERPPAAGGPVPIGGSAPAGGPAPMDGPASAGGAALRDVSATEGGAAPIYGPASVSGAAPRGVSATEGGAAPMDGPASVSGAVPRDVSAAEGDAPPTDGSGSGFAGAASPQPLVVVLRDPVARGFALVGAGFLAVTGVLAILAIAGAPWPTVPSVALAAGIAFGITAAVRPARAAAVLPALLLTAAGQAGLLPTEAGTLAALGALIAAGAVAGTTGTATEARITGWLTALGAAAGFAIAAVLAADLPLDRAAFPVLAVGVLALALGYLLRQRRPGLEARAVDAVGHVAVLPALLLAWDDLRLAAAVATIWGAVLGIRAVLKGEQARWRLAFAAAASELLAWWLLLAAQDVALREAYTLPAAALALVAGYVALHRNARLGSWLALGPGLAAALLPSLTSILVEGGQPWRRLLLGAAAVVIVLVGSHRRWRAPVVAGGLTLVVLIIHELAVWDLLPRWAYMAAGGLALIAVAITYERRLRDLRRVRGALARMT